MPKLCDSTQTPMQCDIDSIMVGFQIQLLMAAGNYEQFNGTKFVSV